MEFAEKVKKDLLEDLEKNILPNLNKKENLSLPEPSEKELEYLQILKSAGFQTKSIKKIESSYFELKGKEKETKEKEELKRLISEIQLKSPYKLISYTSLKRILDKYDLYLGPTSLFKGEVPVKAAEDIKRFLLNKDKLDVYWVGTPVFLNRPSHREIVIAALKKNFNVKGNTIIGREITEFKKPDFRLNIKFSMPDFRTDPIVLAPFRLKDNIIMFFIITAWGKEAKDKDIFNELNN